MNKREFVVMAVEVLDHGGNHNHNGTQGNHRRGQYLFPLASVGLALLVGWRDSVRDSADGVYDTRNDRARFPRHGVH